MYIDGSGMGGGGVEKHANILMEEALLSKMKPRKFYFSFCLFSLFLVWDPPRP